MLRERKRSFNTYEFEDLTLEKLQEGPSPLMDLFEKEENKDLLAKVVSFLNPTDVKFACLATKTMLTGLKGTGWQVSSHRNGTFPDSRVMTPDHGVWFIHEFSSVTTLKKFFERFFDPEIYANTGTHLRQRLGRFMCHWEDGTRRLVEERTNLCRE